MMVYFILCVIGVVGAVELMLYLIFGDQDLGELGLTGLMLIGGMATGGVILSGSMFKSMSLRRGGAVVASDLGGRRVSPGTRDTEERRLLNVVKP